MEIKPRESLAKSDPPKLLKRCARVAVDQCNTASDPDEAPATHRISESTLAFMVT